MYLGDMAANIKWINLPIKGMKKLVFMVKPSFINPQRMQKGYGSRFVHLLPCWYSSIGAWMHVQILDLMIICYTNQAPVHKINGISIVIDVAMDGIW